MASRDENRSRIAIWLVETQNKILSRIAILYYTSSVQVERQMGMRQMGMRIFSRKFYKNLWIQRSDFDEICLKGSCDMHIRACHARGLGKYCSQKTSKVNVLGYAFFLENTCYSRIFDET